jgi:outer membrane protein TolC
MKRSLCLVAVSVLTASCTLGPNYRRPTAGMRSAYRDTAAAVAQPGPASLADVQWFDLFKDDTLTQLVRTSLAQNVDLKEKTRNQSEGTALITGASMVLVTNDCDR